MSELLTEKGERETAVISAGYTETIKTRMANLARDWTDGKEPNPLSAAARFKEEGFFDVQVKPKFQFSRNSRIYTIGSCFARNVEQSLAAAGATLPTMELEVDPAVYVRPPRFRTTVLNKYNPSSMASEILRGIGEQTFPDGGLLQLGEDKWCDPQTSHTGAMTRVQAVTLRGDLDRTAMEIGRCDVVLLTLGLTETWWDAEAQIAFNGLNTVLLRPLRNRLRFTNVGVEQAYTELEVALLALRRMNPTAKVVVTVSPVPLTNTFTAMDVVTANAYSKATLRVVAQRLFEEYDFIDYYPSYEMVTNSARSFAWGPDHAHVTDRVVDLVIDRFIRAYVDG